MVEWFNSVLPHLNLPINASDEDLRALLIDGSVLCQLLNKLKPGSVPEVVYNILILQYAGVSMALSVDLTVSFVLVWWYSTLSRATFRKY